MKLRVVNCKDVRKKHEIKEVVKYTLDKLLNKSKHILNDITITVELNSAKASKDKTWGYCQYTDNLAYPRRFHVVLHRNTSKRNFLEVLMHELVHVKQYALGELKDSEKGLVFWKKKTYNWDIYDLEHVMNIPWEKQAYELSEKLCDKYMQ